MSALSVPMVQPVSFKAWLALAAVAIGLVLVMEADKRLMFKKKSV